MSDPGNYLRALTDRFTPVRSLDGSLIGCIPRIPDNADRVILGTNGAAFELRIAAQVCVCVNLDDQLQSPSNLDGFIPLNDSILARQTPNASVSDGEDPDLAIGV